MHGQNNIKLVLLNGMFKDLSLNVP